jgi:hypothetical protein
MLFVVGLQIIVCKLHDVVYGFEREKAMLAIQIFISRWH